MSIKTLSITSDDIISTEDLPIYPPMSEVSSSDIFHPIPLTREEQQILEAIQECADEHLCYYIRDVCEMVGCKDNWLRIATARIITKVDNFPYTKKTELDRRREVRRANERGKEEAQDSPNLQRGEPIEPSQPRPPRKYYGPLAKLIKSQRSSNPWARISGVYPLPPPILKELQSRAENRMKQKIEQEKHQAKQATKHLYDLQSAGKR
jgi:hypothetical protein